MDILRKKRKTLLIVSGLLYVLFGMLAFFDFPGGHDEHHHTVAHNLTHILLGAILLTATLLSPPIIRQKLCFIFAAAYVVIGTYGILAGESQSLVLVPNLVEFHAGDYAVHLATAFFFYVLGMFKRSDDRPAALA